MRQIAVIGLGNFGSAVARELMEQGAQVIAIDRASERVEALKEAVTYAVALNATDETALRSVGVHNVDAAVVCIGVDIEANLLSTLMLKKLGVKRISARAISPLQQEILKVLQVDSIINLEEEMGRLVARGLVIENVVKHMHVSPGYSVAEIVVPAALVGRTLRQSRLREEFEINVVAIRRKRPQITREGARTFEEYTENVPSPSAVFEENDVLVVVGHDPDIARFSKT
jgi:trk system potassium uptake protein TrkA